MFTIFYQIAKNTFRESLREPIYLLLTLVTLCLIGLFPIFSLFVFSAQEKLVIDSAMATMMMFGWGLAILIASYAIAREIDNGTALLLLSKPVPRPVFIIAKMLGILTANTVFCFLCCLATLISLRIASDQFRLDFWVMGVYFGSIALAFILAAIYNYITRASFPMAAILALTVLMPLVAVFAHFLPYNGERIGLSAALVPALLLIVFSVWAMGSLATALSTRLNLVSNLLLCSVLFILGLMSDYLIGRNSLEKWDDAPAKGKTALWMSSYTFAPTELAAVGRWEKPEKVDQGEAFIVWSSKPNPTALPSNLGKNPTAVWNDREDWKNDLAELPERAIKMATYNAETQNWDEKIVTQERNQVPASAKGMDAAFTSYVFRRTDNPPRMPSGGTYLYPYPKKGSWVATALYAAVPNWQLFWMADALSNKLTVPYSYVILGGAYSIVMNIMLMLLAVILFWEREVGKQIIN
ncbi:MAG: ABC transporter permease subunit [Lentisphaeria bacterium]